MTITIVLQSPFLDRIPSLKTLVVYLSKQGHNIKVISSVSPIFPVSDLSMCHNVKQILVKQREQKFELPTKIKLLLRVLLDLLFNRSDIYMGGDDGGCYLLDIFHRIFGTRYVNFLLEYPDIDDPNQLKRIEEADVLITHDHWHSDFLKQHCNLDGKKILYLPNASYTDEFRGISDYLSKHLGIGRDKVILLHSGGLDIMFMCKELAESAKGWSKGKVLVFHTSHKVEKDPYYISMAQAIEGQDNVLFSMKPVSNDELDELVASATIGVALYSIEELGYRAEYMGVAAGKIGNYLKCGIPVIVNRLPSLSYIEDFKCGILVDNIDDIDSACDKIMANYEVYRDGAYRCYKDIWHPKEYLEDIDEQLSSSIKIKYK